MRSSLLAHKIQQLKTEASFYYADDLFFSILLCLVAGEKALLLVHKEQNEQEYFEKLGPILTDIFSIFFNMRAKCFSLDAEYTTPADLSAMLLARNPNNRDSPKINDLLYSTRAGFTRKRPSFQVGKGSSNTNNSGNNNNLGAGGANTVSPGPSGGSGSGSGSHSSIGHSGSNNSGSGGSGSSNSRGSGVLLSPQQQQQQQQQQQHRKHGSGREDLSEDNGHSRGSGLVSSNPLYTYPSSTLKPTTGHAHTQSSSSGRQGRSPETSNVSGSFISTMSKAKIKLGGTVSQPVQAIIFNGFEKTTELVQNVLTDSLYKGFVTDRLHNYSLPKNYLVVTVVHKDNLSKISPFMRDRFFLSHVLDPHMKSLNPNTRRPPALKNQELESLKETVSNIYVSGHVSVYTNNILISIRRHQLAAKPITPRVSQHLHLSSRAFASILGVQYVTPEHVQILADKVVSHRLVVQPSVPEASSPSKSQRDAFQNNTSSHHHHHHHHHHSDSTDRTAPLAAQNEIILEILNALPCPA